MALPEDVATVPLADQIACVERELAFRARVYPRWVADKKMLQATSDREMLRMRAVLVTLQARVPVICPKCSRVMAIGVPVTCTQAPCAMLSGARL